MTNLSDIGWMPTNFMPVMYFMAEHMERFIRIEAEETDRGPTRAQIVFDIGNLSQLEDKLPDHIDMSDFLTVVEALRQSYIHSSSKGQKATLAAATSLRVFYALLSCLKTGSKTIRPSFEQCLMLEKVEAKISPDDFEMPFPAIVVDFPKKYVDLVTERVGEKFPEFVMLSHEDDSFIASTVSHRLGEPDNMWEFSVHFMRSEYDSMEAALGFTDTLDAAQQDVTTKEGEVIDLMNRIGINIATLMTYCGVIEEKPIPNAMELAAIKKVRKLQRRGDKKNASSDSYQKALGRKLGIPQPVTFVDQKMKLFEQIARESIETEEQLKEFDKGVEKGRKRPHWRRAHFRYQRCGKGHSEKRLTFVRSSFVNKDMFLGSIAADTSVEIMDPKRASPS